MRSHALRLTWSVSTWIVLGAVALFIYQSENRIAQQKSILTAFESGARRAADAIASARISETAYIAPGQNINVWAPQIASLLRLGADTVSTLQQSAQSLDAQAALSKASDAVTTLGLIDGRIRDYAKDDQALMAADVLFTEGAEVAVDAVRHVEVARLSERQAFDAFEYATRRLEAYVLGGSMLVMVLTTLFFAWGKTGSEGIAADEAPGIDASLGHQLVNQPGSVSGAAARSTATLSPPLRSVADLCAALAQADDLGDLEPLMSRATDLLDATGAIVWVGSAQGADLRPASAYGYSEDVIARLPTVPRSADNALAAAYRTGTLQVAPSRPGSYKGAIAAPILAPAGCIGVFTAEIREHEEVSDRAQATAALIAAQLAPLLSSSRRSASVADVNTPKTATA